MFSTSSRSSSRIKQMPRCSLAASNSGFSSVHLFMVLRCEHFDTLDHSSDQMFPGLVVTCFVVNLN